MSQTILDQLPDSDWFISLTRDLTNTVALKRVPLLTALKEAPLPAAPLIHRLLAQPISLLAAAILTTADRQVIHAKHLRIHLLSAHRQTLSPSPALTLTHSTLHPLHSAVIL